MEYTVIDDIVHWNNESYEHFLHHRGVLSEKDFYDIVDSFSLAEAFAEVREILLITKNNGKELLNYLSPDVVSRNYYDSVHQKEMIREANRMALNFATSFKTILDISERILSSNGGDASVKAFKKYESLLFDSHFCYRFWIRLRNYVVHRKMLYCGIVANAESVKIVCNPKELLAWKGWSAQLKKEIELLNGEEDFSDTIAPLKDVALCLAAKLLTLLEDEYEYSKYKIEMFYDKYNIKGELYLSEPSEDNSLVLSNAYYAPYHEISNMQSLIDWRNYHLKKADIVF